jgi:uncharacterized cofD-like protein
LIILEILVMERYSEETTQRDARAESYAQDDNRRASLRVVVDGGGTGTSTVISGLVQLPGVEVTAVINSFDNGGGTGRLRDDYETPAVGDLRNCMEALIDDSSLLGHRFREGKVSGKSGLYGQTVGNLLITAALQQNGGNLSQAVREVGGLFKMRGRVLPVSDDNRHISLVTRRGVDGEHQIEEYETPSFRGAQIKFDVNPTDISEDAEDAIRNADIVVLAPGDLYTSIGPTLVVRGMREALSHAKAVVQVTNNINRRNQVFGYTGHTYVNEMERLLSGGGEIKKRIIDRVLYNTDTPEQDSLDRYAEVGEFPVKVSPKGLRKLGYGVVGKPLLAKGEAEIDPNDAIADTRSKVRHDPLKVAHAILGIYYGNGFANKHEQE